jgi:hypothetical protein
VFGANTTLGFLELLYSLINADCGQVESGVKVGGSNGRELIGR